MRALGSGTLLISSLAQISRVATWEAERPERTTGCSWGALGSGARPRQSPRGQGVGPTGEPQDGASGHTPPIPPDSPTPRGRNVCSCSGKLRRRAEGTPSGGSCSKGRPQSGLLEDPATQSWGLGEARARATRTCQEATGPRAGAVPLTEFCHSSFSGSQSAVTFLGKGCKGGPGAGGGVRK